MRMVYGCSTALAMLAGLAVRRKAGQLPDFVAEHFGDALWAAMVYLGLRFILAEKRREYALFASALFCCAIEFGQLYQAEWINNVRGTTIGALVLGSGFLYVDLVRYSAGILITYALDNLIRYVCFLARSGANGRR